MDNNTITVEMQIPCLELYSWACKLTTEQEEEVYFPNNTAKTLLRRLVCTKGNLIAVVGCQGIGKTSLRQWLQRELCRLKGKRVYSAKWTENELSRRVQQIGEFDFSMFYDEDYLQLLKEALDSERA